MISDGNNIANAACRQDLVNLYDAWENGPAGRSTGRDVVDEPFAELRRRLIAGRHPSMPDDTLDYLARHTSGLFGDYLMQIVDRYLAGGEFIERPYRRGICPTNPLDGGAVMEFGFHPQQVELELAAYGIAARQVFPDPEVDCSTAKRALGTTFNLVRHRLRRLLGPAASRAASWGFQIVGVKQG